MLTIFLATELVLFGLTASFLVLGALLFFVLFIVYQYRRLKKKQKSKFEIGFDDDGLLLGDETNFDL